jgi:hypothetical protein
MAPIERHPDDITHIMLRSFYALLGVSATAMFVLILVKPASYWDATMEGFRSAPMPCVKDATMEM